MDKGFLPIGSVVLLKGGTKKVMITGFCSIDNDNTEKVYDYTGCIYPEGILNSNELRLFDNNEIEQVFYRGFEDEEQENFLKILNDVMSEYNKGVTEVENNDEQANETDEPEIIYQNDTQEILDNSDTEESFE